MLDHRSKYLQLKPVVDLLLALLIMCVALPIILLVGFTILLLDGRPIFYSQTRVGLHGRLFRIWKFRTMRADAEKGIGAVWCGENDRRVTRLGTWLRSLHLDELPQLLNVLKGDMSVVGPRPERPEFVQQLTQAFPYYQLRHSLRPGITGLAQLKLGYDRSFADVEKKVLLDLEYIRTTSLMQDFRLVLQTIPYIANRLLERIGSSQQIARPCPPATVGDLKPTPRRCQRIEDARAGVPAVPAPHRSAISLLENPIVVVQSQGH